MSSSIKPIAIADAIEDSPLVYERLLQIATEMRMTFQSRVLDVHGGKSS